MNYRIALLPCPMQENDRLARHMMQRAQQGWMICRIWRNLMLYRRCAPHAICLRADCLDRTHAFTLTDSDTALDYDAFLRGYGCRRICGYGFRQIIEVPDEDFLLRDPQDQRLLESACDQKERGFRRIIRAVLAAACFLTVLIQYRFDFYSPLNSLLWMISCLFLITLITSGRMIWRLRSLRTRGIALCILRAFILILFVLFVWRSNAWTTAALGTLSLLILFLLQQPALKRGWFTRNTLHYLSLALMLGIGSLMLIRIFPLPAASWQERETYYIENRNIEPLPVLYESPFNDGEVLVHQRIERPLGSGTEYSYARKDTQQLFHYEAYENTQHLTLPEAFSKAGLGDLHDSSFAEQLDIAPKEVWLLKETVGFRMEDTIFRTYTLAFADEGNIVLVSLPGYAYDEQQAKAFMDSLQ